MTAEAAVASVSCRGAGGALRRRREPRRRALGARGRLGCGHRLRSRRGVAISSGSSGAGAIRSGAGAALGRGRDRLGRGRDRQLGLGDRGGRPLGLTVGLIKLDVGHRLGRQRIRRIIALRGIGAAGAGERMMRAESDAASWLNGIDASSRRLANESSSNGSSS